MENPLPFSLTAPKRGGGGVGGVSRLRFPPGPPPPKQPFQPTPTPSPGSKNCNLRGLGGFCGEKARPLAGPKPWGPGPQAPGAWITSCGANSWVRVSKPTISPNLLTSGGVGWFSHERRVPVFAPAFQPQAPENLANKPLSPASRQPSRVKNSKNAPVLIGS